MVPALRSRKVAGPCWSRSTGRSALKSERSEAGHKLKSERSEAGHKLKSERSEAGHKPKCERSEAGTPAAKYRRAPNRANFTA